MNEQRGFESLLSLVVLLVLVGIGLTALFVLCHVLLPNFTTRTQHTLEQRPGRSFLVGLINFIFFGLVSAALMGGGAGGIGALLATILLSFIAVGLAVVARLVGERLSPDERSRVRQVLLGSLTLELAALVPIVGWFALPLVAGLTGYGATILTMIWRRTPAPAVEQAS